YKCSAQACASAASFAADSGRRCQAKPACSIAATASPGWRRVRKLTSTPRSRKAPASARQRITWPWPMVAEASARITAVGMEGPWKLVAAEEASAADVDFAQKG